MTGRDLTAGPYAEGFRDGHDAGLAAAAVHYLTGYSEGYQAALRVLDDAGALLAAQRPSDAVDDAAARRARTTYPPGLTAEEIRDRAHASWAAVEADIAARHPTDHTDHAEAACDAAVSSER